MLNCCFMSQLFTDPGNQMKKTKFWLNKVELVKLNIFFSVWFGLIFELVLKNFQ